MTADQLLANLAEGRYDNIMTGEITYLDYLKAFHPAEYKERTEKMATVLDLCKCGHRIMYHEPNNGRGCKLCACRKSHKDVTEATDA